MRNLCSISLLALLCVCPRAAAQDRAAIKLNDEGIAALNLKQYPLSINLLEKACRLDSGYSLAKANLAIAHNNFALHLYQQHRDNEALKEFHRGLSINPDKTTQANMLQFIKLTGRDPQSFSDRVSLGDQSLQAKDFTGAVIEYQAALDLKESKSVRMKLGHAYELLHDKKKAVQQFEAASRAKD